MKTIGIDFGTSTCEVASVVGRVSSVLAIDGQREVPTLVVFREGKNGAEAVVGKEAFRLHYQAGNPNIVRSVKREFGTDTTYDFFGKRFEPRFVAAQILRHLIVGASRALETKELEIVATYPANWSQPQINDLEAAYVHAMDSLASDGFTLGVKEYIREPVAASLARKLGRHVSVGSFVIMLDPGGGTTDFAILQLTTERLVTVKASRGVPRFGGDDCDSAIANWILNECFLQGETKTRYEDLDDAGKAEILTKIVWAARRAKEELTNHPVRKSVEFVAPYLLDGETGPLSCMGRLERPTMTTLITPLIAQCDHAIDQLLTDAGIGVGDLAIAIPLGGTSMLAAFQDFISRKLPRVKVLTEGSPLTMVAQGAAMRAAGQVELQDIAGHDYYIEANGQQLIMERSHPIGRTKTLQFRATRTGQGEARIKIFKDFGVAGMARPKVAEFRIPVNAHPNARGNITLTLVHEDKLRIKAKCGGVQQDEEARDVAEPDAQTRANFARWLRDMSRDTDTNNQPRQQWTTQPDQPKTDNKLGNTEAGRAMAAKYGVPETKPGRKREHGGKGKGKNRRRHEHGDREDEDR